MKGGEHRKNLGVAEFCCGIVKVVSKCIPHFHRVVNIIDEWKEFIAASEVYLL